MTEKHKNEKTENQESVRYLNSKNSKELAEKIREVSSKLMKKNYNLYKSLADK